MPVQVTIGTLTGSESSAGPTGGVGVAWFFGGSVALALSLFATAYGVGFRSKTDDFEEQKEVTVFGVEFSLRAR